LAAATFFSLCSGFITPIVDGISISLPILGVSSTVGLNTVLATLGALKLGAALALLISNHEKEAESYSTVEDVYTGYTATRQRRSAEGTDLTSVMEMVENLDRSNCAKQLVCQLNTVEEEKRTPEERLIISLFDKNRRYASKTSVYEFSIAAKIGRTTRSERECQTYYKTCPYTSTQMMSFFKSL